MPNIRTFEPISKGFFGTSLAQLAKNEVKSVVKHGTMDSISDFTKHFSDITLNKNISLTKSPKTDVFEPVECDLNVFTIF